MADYSSMLLGAFTIAARQWLWPVVIVFCIGFALIVWQAFRSPLPPRLRALSIICRGLALALLAFCLLEPIRSENRARPGANFFALLADNSMGMTIHDPGSEQSRGELLAEALHSEKQQWITKLGESFQLRHYLFDSRLSASRNFTDLSFDGRASGLRGAITQLSERFKGQPLAGALLFTDGNATDMPNGVADIQSDIPIYPMVAGKSEDIKDISINSVGVTQTAFEDAPVTITAEVQSSAITGDLRAELLIQEAGLPSDQQNTSATNNPPAYRVLETKIASAQDNKTALFRFQTRPVKTGVNFYTVRVTSANASTNRLEATLHNNSRTVAVDRGKGPYRILYVSGRPNWEFKFLNRALSEDDQLEIVGLIRIARREPKFTFRGRSGESSNPLFRGFNNVDEETQRYDQPVLIRLNTKDEVELRDGFPKTAEALYRYHAIILDDIESEFFTADQLMLIQKFVSERGGGFMMLGGVDSLGAGKYGRTPVGDMLPVYLQGGQTEPSPEDLKLDFTREGWLQPWARLRGTEPEETSRLQSLPGLNVLNRVHGVKPGANTILYARDPSDKSYPGLVVQRFGQGRTGALMFGDLWRTGLREESMQKDLAKFWRQLGRWLTTDVPKQIELTVQPKAGDPDQAVLLKVHAKDKNFQPLENANVRLTVTAPALDGGTNVINLPADPSAEESGVYLASFIPRVSGAYMVSAHALDQDGISMGLAETGWVSDPLADEFKSLKPNVALLEAIAKKTGGEMIPMERLLSFVETLPSKKAPFVEAHSIPLWHQPFIFLAALACMVVEWGVRRWKGLA
ncbi:MAG: glutamine amidotransferase [Verrucomicrobiales bacterium]